MQPCYSSSCFSISALIPHIPGSIFYFVDGHCNFLYANTFLLHLRVCLLSPVSSSSWSLLSEALQSILSIIPEPFFFFNHLTTVIIHLSNFLCFTFHLSQSSDSPGSPRACKVLPSSTQNIDSICNLMYV